MRRSGTIQARHWLLHVLQGMGLRKAPRPREPKVVSVQTVGSVK